MTASGSDWARRSAVEVAKGILQGDISLIEGCVRLSGLGRDVVPDFWNDAAFHVFGIVASETDHFPIGPARAHWSPRTLEREDPKISEYEAARHDEVFEACRSVISRFSSPD
jgi:hypothetical protein